jgi:carbonic anhydrase
MTTTDKAISIDDAVLRLYKNNMSYTKNTPQSLFNSVQTGQWPWVGIVNCSDSRITVGSILGVKARMGQAFNCSCAGTLVASMRGSIEFAVDNLGIKLLFIEGHTKCAMVKAALADDISGQRKNIQKDAKSVKKKIDSVDIDPKISSLDDLTQGVIMNTFAQANEVQSWFKKEVKSGEVTVISSLYDLHDKIGGGFGRQYIYSINGEICADDLMKHPAMAKLDRSQRADILLTRERF